jgi:hypothetical protein
MAHPSTGWGGVCDVQNPHRGLRLCGDRISIAVADVIYSPMSEWRSHQRRRNRLGEHAPDAGALLAHSDRRQRQALDALGVQRGRVLPEASNGNGGDPPNAEIKSDHRRARKRHVTVTSQFDFERLATSR